MIEKEKYGRRKENHFYNQKKEKRIKVCEFLILVRKLRISDFVSDHQPF